MQVATFSDFRQNMKAIMDIAVDKHDFAVIVHRGHAPSVMVSLDDYNRMCQLRSVNASKSKKQSPFGLLKGLVEIKGDIVNFETSDMWECLQSDNN